jgi:hypothetical protein
VLRILQHGLLDGSGNRRVWQGNCEHVVSVVSARLLSRTQGQHSTLSSAARALQV